MAKNPQTVTVLGCSAENGGFGDTHEPHAADYYEEGSEKHAEVFCRVSLSLQIKVIKT